MPSFLEILRGSAPKGRARSTGTPVDAPLIRAPSEKIPSLRTEARKTGSKPEISAQSPRTKEPTKIVLTDREPSSEGLLAELMGTRSAAENLSRNVGVNSADSDKPTWIMTPPARQKSVGMLLDAARTLMYEVEWSDEDISAVVKKVMERAARLMPTELRVGPREINEASVELVELLVGFGPLKELMSDPHVTDICVDGYDTIRCIRAGRALETPFTFHSREDYRGFVTRINRLLGYQVSVQQPVVEGMVQFSAQLDSRVRVQCLHGSLRGALDPSLVIRLQRFPFVSLYDLLKAQVLPAPIAAFLSEVVSFRESTLLIVGPPCSGKTTLTSALLGAVGSDERVALVEYIPELHLVSSHAERFSIGRNVSESQHHQTLRHVGTYLHKAPVHRVVFGELRGDEVALFIELLESGRKGSLATVASSSQRSAIDTLTYALSHQMGGAVDAARNRLSEQVNLVLTMAMESGRPCLCEVAEVIPEIADLVPLVRYEGESKGKRYWRMTGEDTPLLRRLSERGVELMTSPHCLPPLATAQRTEDVDGTV